jgi:hypothetical protein
MGSVNGTQRFALGGFPSATVARCQSATDEIVLSFDSPVLGAEDEELVDNCGCWPLGSFVFIGAMPIGAFMGSPRCPDLNGDIML